MKADRNIPKKLTQEERQLQHDRGWYYRRLLSSITQDFLEGIDRERVGILLSGGVDSSTVLWTLIEQGVRPYIYTFHLPTPEDRGLSTDARKAQRLAEHYRLPLRIIEMPSDPDELARLIKKIDDEHPEIESRADFETLPIMLQMMIEARDKDGIQDIFSGMADGAIHLTNRKLDIRARYGKMPLPEADARRMLQLPTPQVETLAELASEYGIRLYMPLLLVAIQQPYYGVPWHVMHDPRKKAITIIPWEQEEEESGVSIMPQPMQVGDSGGRIYYDHMISNSSFATRECGRKPTSAQVYYNYLKSRFSKTPFIGGNFYWDWFASVNGGALLDDKDTAKILNPDTKKAWDPTRSHNEESSELEDIFDIDDHDNVKYFLDENGKIDTRVDCFGNPFYKGESEAFTKCPRAQAGLCTTPRNEKELRIHECELWDDWQIPIWEHVDEVANVATSQAKSIYLKWKNEAQEELKRIKKSSSFNS